MGSGPEKAINYNQGEKEAVLIKKAYSKLAANLFSHYERGC